MHWLTRMDMRVCFKLVVLQVLEHAWSPIHLLDYLGPQMIPGQGICCCNR